MLNQRQFSLWVSVGLCLALLGYPKTVFSEGEGSVQAGPIPVVNQSPIQLLFLQPIPDRAETFQAGHGWVQLTTTLTNTLVSRESAHYQGHLDMEMVRTSLDAAFGVSPNLEVGFSLPMAHHYSGVLDGLIHDVEDAVGDPRGVRGAEERNSFTYFVKKDGETFISAEENSTGVGDAALRVKMNLFDEGDFYPTLSGRVSVKLPTGSRARGLGSGEMDWGVGLLLEKDMKGLSLYLNADVIFPGEAFEDVGLSLREFYTVMLGVEYRVSQRFSVISQAGYLSRPFEHTGIEILDRRIYELLVGFDFRTRGNRFFQGGVVEDILDSPDATADVSLFLNVGVGF